MAMDTEEIHAVRSILHLVYHRNKNQHSRAKWWKWLSMLKRTTSDLASPTLSPSTVESYRQHLASHLIPRCYVAFSTVVADNQFSTLGIVLMAALGRLTKATGANRRLGTCVQQSTKKTPTISSSEDRGERVSRGDGDTSSGTGQSQKRQELPRAEVKTKPKSKSTTSDEKASVPRPKKSSKRKKNAIDDLFSGLL